MREFYKQLLENNKEWVEKSLALDPNYFADSTIGRTKLLLIHHLETLRGRYRYIFYEIFKVFNLEPEQITYRYTFCLEHEVLWIQIH